MIYHADKIYLQMLQDILDNGSFKGDRTGTGTYSVFGRQYRYDLNQGFPLLTTKKMFTKAIIHELIWFIRGESNIKYLVDNDVHIWDDWPHRYYVQQTQDKITVKEFAQKVKNDVEFAKRWGELGPVYGVQWRRWRSPDGAHVDQLQRAIDDIKNKPDSRRIIVSAWNAADIDEMAKSGLPPCHALFQFYVNDNKLSCQLYQRSADSFLGVPFNIASYALLTQMIAHTTGLQLGDFVHTFGDLHIYSNHVDQVKEQLARKPYPMPKLWLNPKVKNLFDFTFADIKIEDYQSHPMIKAPIAV